jgi:hypothetical protein
MSPHQNIRRSSPVRIYCFQSGKKGANSKFRIRAAGERKRERERKSGCHQNPRSSTLRHTTMANREEPRAQTLGKRKHMETEEDLREEMEIEKLKSELHEMARRVIDYRKTVPDLLTKALRSNLAAHRPIDPPMLEFAASTGMLFPILTFIVSYCMHN